MTTIAEEIENLKAVIGCLEEKLKANRARLEELYKADPEVFITVEEWDLYQKIQARMTKKSASMELARSNLGWSIRHGWEEFRICWSADCDQSRGSLRYLTPGQVLRGLELLLEDSPYETLLLIHNEMMAYVKRRHAEYSTELVNHYVCPCPHCGVNTLASSNICGACKKAVKWSDGGVDYYRGIKMSDTKPSGELVRA